MKKTKKLLCLILALLLVTVMMSGSLSAFADGGLTGNGYVDLGDVVQITEYSDGILHLMYYPKWMETTDCALPVVVWANGTGCPPLVYINILKNIAAEGFVCVESSNIMAGDGNDQIQSLDYILAKAADPSSIFYGKVDGNRAALFGHSQGGRGVVNAAVKDPRFKCAVYLAGSSYLWEAVQLRTPTLFITGSADFFVWAPMWVRPTYELAQGPAVYTSLVNGYHTKSFFKPSVYTYYVTEWFRAWLDGAENSKAKFRYGGELQKDPGWTDFAAKNF